MAILSENRRYGPAGKKRRGNLRAAEAYYREIPKEIATKGNLLIDSGLRRVVREFNEVMNVE